MLVILHPLGMFICDLLKSRCRLQAENLFLRHSISPSGGHCVGLGCAVATGCLFRKCRPKINLDNIGLGCAEWLSPHLGLRDRGFIARQKRSRV